MRRGEWNCILGNAGGSSSSSFSKNPQFYLTLESENPEPVEITCSLMLDSEDMRMKYTKNSIGFQIFDVKGERATDQHKGKIHENHRGYQYMRSVMLECKLAPKKTAYTIVPSTLFANVEATFSFTLWYKKRDDLTVHFQ